MKPRLNPFLRHSLRAAAAIGLAASSAQAVDYNFGSITDNFTITASDQARVQGVSTGTGTFSDNGFGGVYDRGAAQDALYMHFNLGSLSGATINGDVNLNLTVNATWGGAINGGIIGTATSAWTYPGSAPGITTFTPVSAPNGTFTNGQTASWTIANSTFTGILGNLGSFNGLAVTAGDGSTAHFSTAATLTGNFTTTGIRVIGGSDWSAASWNDTTRTLSIAGSSNVTDGNVIMIPGTTLSVGGSATLGGGIFSGTFQSDGTISYGSSSAQTLSGAISGGGSIIQAGSGALTLSGAVSGSGSITQTGSGTLAISGGMSGNRSLTQAGSGTLTLTNNNSYTGATTVNAGRLILSGNSTGGGAITIADTASGKAAMEVSGTITGSNGLNIGSASNSVGALRQTAGSVTRNFLALGVTTGSYGAASVSGGSLTITGDANIASWGSGYQTGGGRGGLLEISNGTVAVGGWLTMNRWGGDQDAVLNVSGGSLTYAGGGLVANWNADGADTSVITVSGTGSIATTNNSAINLSNNASSANTGILNLNGGTVTPSGIYGGRGFVNFNGGTLKANSDNSNFLSVNTAQVRSGGAIIDTNGKNITINQALLAPADNGVTTIAVTDGGSGYVSAPILTISGGTGSGATAIANMVDDGSGNGTFRIGSITVTGAGNYTAAPNTITQTGGGATTQASGFSFGTAANTSGGLTKNGSGSLTLGGVNTFTGGLTVNEGLVVISNDNNLGAASGGVTLNGGGLKGSAAITLGSGRTITLGASGGYFSNGSNQSWTINSKLTGAGFIGFNYDSSTANSMTLTSTTNDYSGETRIGTNGPGYYPNNAAAANLKLGAANALSYGTGKGNVIVGYDVNGTAKASLDLNGFSANINGLSTNNAANASVNNSSATAATLTLGNGDASASFGGVIEDTGGALSLIKTGSGTQTLTGVNTYEGSTTVSQGTLVIGTGGSIANTSTIHISSGANLDVSAATGFTVGATQSLTGFGSVKGDISVQGTLGIGASPGTMTFEDDLTLGSNSVSNFEINGFSAGNYDLAVAAALGTQNVAFNGGILNLLFQSGFNTAGSVKIFDFDTYSGSGFTTVNTTGLADGYTATFDITSGVVTVIPEPRAALLGGLGLLMLLRRRR
jgi:autotransporter-associated beta strand protein